MPHPDRETTTTTFTARTIAEARAKLAERFNTEIVVELRGTTLYHWAAKLARAGGRMVEDRHEVIVEVTEVISD